MLKDSDIGQAVYSEIHRVKTNQFGLINLAIGYVKEKVGIFSDIDWGSDSYYVKLDMDKNGGSDYVTMGVSQLLSVPYALYAGNTMNSAKSSAWWTTNNRTFLNNPQNPVCGIGTAYPQKTLEVIGSVKADTIFAKHNWNDVYNSPSTFSGYGITAAINDLSDGITGGGSVFLGSKAGVNDDGTDNRNVGFGKNALRTNTSGYRNTASGYAALYRNTSGYYNTANGYTALYYNSSGSRNTANGYAALFKNTEGYNNTGTGFMALYYNTTGYRNTANGYAALYKNTEGYNNTANGYAALYYNTTGDRNTAGGYAALRKNTTGNNNTAFGYNANYYNQEGSNNTTLGYQAGQGTALHNKSGNVFIGFQAGKNEHGSNKLYIENSSSSTPLIYGEFDNDLLAINGKVGIGISLPTTDLDVNGTLRVEKGTSINEISTDTTLAGNSDDAVPTEKAVKVYIDALEERVSVLEQPSLFTTAASSIDANTATCGGNIETLINSRGVCWSTSTNPTLADNFTTNGIGNGVYTSSLSGLSMYTTYYVRAYAVTNADTVYGNEISFITLGLPILTTTAATSITYTSAISGGNITTDGGAFITVRGICWSTSPNPTIADSTTTEGNGTGTFTSSISSLSPGTTYYLRAYATNSVGTGYGNEISFTTIPCGDSINDLRDGNSYSTVLIGSQCWITENMAYLPSVSFSNTGSSWWPHYYVYNYSGTDVSVAISTSNYNTYGVLYNWPAAASACPSGWHIPSDGEWTILSDHLGGTGVAGGEMKESGTTHWNSPNTGATNNSGFTALPTGYRSKTGSFVGLRGTTSYWSTTHFFTHFYWSRNLSKMDIIFGKNIMDQQTGSPVRCLRN